MISNESKIEIISEILYDHLKGKHKDALSKKLAEDIIEAIDDEPTPSWYEHGQCYNRNMSDMLKCYYCDNKPEFTQPDKDTGVIVDVCKKHFIYMYMG